MAEDELVRPDVMVSDRLPLEKSGEPVIRFVKAVSGLGDDVMRLNMRNDGATRGIPSDVFVEVRVRVGKGEVALLPVSLGDKVMRLVLPVRMEKMERALEAYISGDRSHILEALLEDP
ncbi:family 4 glycosyl hydrolase [Tardisphaera miroshnichenkoae]